ncbi:NAD(P)-binding domain-containing protein [Streptomyces sp. NPDC006393]|uniref:NAD(P)-binding domain-containing protein n=1 Tax=Streptomyces sp. NPDC006393 TaxID=3156763 RepID=UPI0033DEA39A
MQDGGRLSTRAAVAASGTFGHPYRPALPPLNYCSGAVLHAARYRTPEPFAGQRVAVMGAGNSAVQIAAELAGPSRVTLASRAPVQLARQWILGGDLHFWLRDTGLDAAQMGGLLREPPTQRVIDDGHR